MADYQTKVRNSAGVQQAVFGVDRGHAQASKTGVLSLLYRKRVNQAGYGQIVLPVTHELLTVLDNNWIIEFWRKPDGGSWAMDFGGIWRRGQWQYGADQQQVVLRCLGFNELLRWRHVAWYAGTASRSYFEDLEAETIAKTLVTYNITSSATTANGRIRAGTNYPATQITVEADAAAGNALDWYCAYDNLLATLIELSRVGGGDFNLEYGGTGIWQFKWYDGQLGSDVSASVVFSLGYGNMQNPVYTLDREQEATVALVGGQGKQDERDVITRTGDDYSASNDIETFVSATDVEFGDSSALEDRGDEKLEKSRQVESFDYEIIQTQGSQYGVDYGLGYLVSVLNPFTGAAMTQKVTGVTVAVDAEGRETVDPELETV